MYRHEETLTMPIYTSAAWRFYTDGMTIGFLDLETTGLSHQRDHIILGGLLKVSPGYAPSSAEVQLIQLLCDTPSEEKAMLQAFWDEMTKCQVIVTFNGDSFDLSILKKKLIRYGILSEEETPLFLSVDLYRLFQNGCPMASLLPDLRQKTVENALGLDDLRKDQIDGAESVTLYEQYAGQPEGDCREELRKVILLHNRDDILQLTRLMKILNKVDLHLHLNRKGFLVPVDDYIFKVDQISLNRKELIFEASTRNLNGDRDLFDPAFRLSHNNVLKRLKVQISMMYLQECIIADLEALPGDYSQLQRHSGYESGYLILHQDDQSDRFAINHLIKVFLREVFHENQSSTG